ncbi:MAG: hypothetical protein KF878_30150 [Planctomycetes bacterium]|nr:hypothetical protein [Planctomycetota bacterium]
MLPGIALLSLALAVGGVVRRCGGSWSDGFLGVCVIGYPLLFAARLVELSQTPPYRASSTAIEAALVGLPLLALAVSLLCAAADALVVKFVGTPTTDGAPA